MIGSLLKAILASQSKDKKLSAKISKNCCIIFKEAVLHLCEQKKLSEAEIKSALEDKDYRQFEKTIIQLD